MKLRVVRWLRGGFSNSVTAQDLSSSLRPVDRTTSTNIFKQVTKRPLSGCDKARNYGHDTVRKQERRATLMGVMKEDEVEWGSRNTSKHWMLPRTNHVTRKVNFKGFEDKFSKPIMNKENLFWDLELSLVSAIENSFKSTSFPIFVCGLDCAGFKCLHEIHLKINNK